MDSCFICSEDDPRVLKEYHHVFGKTNNPVNILLCHNCHDKITHEQNKFPPYARKKTASKILKRAYAIRSFGAFLEISGKELVKFSGEILEEHKKCHK